MSDYGLLIRNSNGEIQIDATYRNLSLEQSGSTTVSNQNTAGGFYTRQSITSSPLVPLVLVKPNTDHFVSVRNYYKSGSNFAGVDFVTEYNQSTTIEWAVFRENLTSSSDTYGLRVYNSSNELCFDSGKRYLKIREVHTITLDSPTNSSQPYVDISHPGVTDPYYVLSKSCYWVYCTPLNPPYYGWSRFLMGVKKLSSTSVRVGWMEFAHYVEQGASCDRGLNPTFELLVCTT